MSTDLDRLIQIEDIWTRRIIMEPIRNSERRAEFEAIKSFWRCFPHVLVMREPYVTSATILEWRGKI